MGGKGIGAVEIFGRGIGGGFSIVFFGVHEVEHEQCRWQCFRIRV